MARKILLCSLTVALAGVGWFLYSFGIFAGWWGPLTRPAGVSRRAKYVTIVESAAWFDCTVDAGRNVDVCKAWDTNGRLVTAGCFRLEGENRAATVEELHPSSVGASRAAGLPPDTITLFGPNHLIWGKTLVRVDSAGCPN